MRLSYDPRYNIAYITVRDKPVNVETLHISEEVNIDIGVDGILYGIELLNANQQLKQGKDASHFEIINEASGNRQDIPLHW